ncbi:bifunctional tRNA (5-methylaminomethyl-2-thiouridine)(34)-methyltransferase MnmD/FAD-dependent 5-carboxymethylaminomethyl-2-thiouridine(34) oxidoreductase MnmC [Noviherbaspirillum sp.]|uniref:bifunctional tRNA (5-methylaminomethyl-2-thiouridine)(34)-methyltransferase MnmD/FAD-dependent 5-carboxymethylaminomethyl-2-thiouridine(34) oxidoreductase MnmC n=1 Tax=Noviherbaspirillum sp. TaxID=1926288 RepID=UPI002FE40167
MIPTPLLPASLTNDTAHMDGALTRARDLYLAGTSATQRWKGRESFVVLDTGFGAGANFLSTWKAWQDDAAAPRLLHYLAVEPHPFSLSDLARVHAGWPELAVLSAQLRAAWPPPMPGFHRLLLADGRVMLTLILSDDASWMAKVEARADAFYLHPAPADTDRSGQASSLSRLGRLAATDAVLAGTDDLPDPARAALAQAGFRCAPFPLPDGQRGLVAQFAPRWQVSPAGLPAPQRKAIVIGAGLAGSAACERLAARGWQVTLIERHDRPGQEASGNLAGIVKPLLARDDNPAARLARAAYLFALRYWRHLGGIGTAFDGEACGVLQVAAGDEDAQDQCRTAMSHQYPANYVRWLDGTAVSALLAGEPSHGGWLFPEGGWVRPSSFCDAMLAAGGERIQRRFASSATMLIHADQHWRVTDAGGTTIAEAPVVILANGTYATSFPQTDKLPLTAIRGQVTHLPARSLPELPVVVSGEGYLTRAVDGICSVGASYDFDDDHHLRLDSHAQNLARLSQLLPNAGRAVADAALAGRVGFRCASPDRLPLVGPLPDQQAGIGGSRLRDVPRLPGLYGLLGYGSRGLVWAPFCAELLAAQLNGEPLPAERDLVQALDPARFALKAHRRGG